MVYPKSNTPGKWVSERNHWQHQPRWSPPGFPSNYSLPKLAPKFNKDQKDSQPRLTEPDDSRASLISKQRGELQKLRFYNLVMKQADIIKRSSESLDPVFTQKYNDIRETAQRRHDNYLNEVRNAARSKLDVYLEFNK